MSFIVSIFDTETTGIPSSRLIDLDKQPEIIEFTAIKFDLEKDDIIKEYDFLVKPKKEIPEEITEITSITNAMVSDALLFKDRVLEIKDALENADAVIAHNLSFDKEIVEIELERIKDTINWRRLICTVEATMCIKGYRLSLTDLHKDLTGDPFAGAHRSRSDVEALLRCVKVLYIRGFI